LPIADLLRPQLSIGNRKSAIAEGAMITVEIWLKGLVAAFVSAAATAASGAAATRLSDLRAIGVMALVSGIAGALLYLKQSPVPK
jgi:hypothetical protein